MRTRWLGYENPGSLVLHITSWILIYTAASSALSAQTMSDVVSRHSAFVSQARELYRFDQEKLELIWAAYCGALDPSVPGGKEIAGDVGYAFQRDGQGRLESLLQTLSKLRSDAEKLEQADSTKARARSVLEDLKREESVLLKVKDGVVLRGSNHPFTQYAIEHGKKMHEEMCGRFKADAPVCDQSFGSRSRPDLVTVSSGKLMVYEFKPKGQESKAQSEAEGYVRDVEKYYKEFFPEGRKGPTRGSPDRGGDAMLKALVNANDAWSSDGKELKATPKAETYDRCNKPS